MNHNGECIVYSPRSIQSKMMFGVDSADTHPAQLDTSLGEYAQLELDLGGVQ